MYHVNKSDSRSTIKMKHQMTVYSSSPTVVPSIWGLFHVNAFVVKIVYRKINGINLTELSSTIKNKTNFGRN